MAYDSAGKQCLRVEIEYSGDTPHFGGPAWIRKGSESVLASDAEFQRLINIRTSIVRELDQWLGRDVTLEIRTTYGDSTRAKLIEARITFVNQFYLTAQFNSEQFSYPLKIITLTRDDRKDRLKIIVEQVAIARHSGSA